MMRGNAVALISRLWHVGVLGLLSMLCAASFMVIYPAAVADLVSMKARWQIDQWSKPGAAAPTIVEWGGVRSNLARALEHTPDDSRLHELMGWLYADQAMRMMVLMPDVSRAYMRQALHSYQQALRFRPMSGVLWASVAMTAHRLGDGRVLWTAFDKAIAYGYRVPTVQHEIVEVAFSRWSEMDPVRRERVLQMVRNAHPRVRRELEHRIKRHHMESLFPPAPMDAAP